MTSPAKLAANRANAQHSTGPKSEAGKAAMAANPMKHGIEARDVVLPSESAEVWEAHRAAVVASLNPENYLETVLAERVASALWRLGRVARFESGQVAGEVEFRDPDETARRSRELLVPRDNVLERATKYEAHLERSLARMLNELRALQGTGSVSRKEEGGE